MPRIHVCMCAFQVSRSQSRTCYDRVRYSTSYVEWYTTDIPTHIRKNFAESPAFTCYVGSIEAKPPFCLNPQFDTEGRPDLESCCSAWTDRQTVSSGAHLWIRRLIFGYTGRSRTYNPRRMGGGIDCSIVLVLLGGFDRRVEWYKY